MMGIGIALILLIATAIGYLIWKTSEPLTPTEPIDPKKAMEVAIELHRIRRRLDVAQLKHEQERDAAQLKRELAEALGKSDAS